MLQQFILRLSKSNTLTEEQVAVAVEQLADEAIAVTLKAEFLTALATKGETAEEIAAFVRALRLRCIQPQLEPAEREREILDVVGTGGDRLSTFNISTTVAILASAADVWVAKHGNRASTSTIGSADVIEALGIPFDAGPQDAVRSLRKHGFAFFFAPKYHPSFRHIIPARKLCAERGQATIFNFLGPLLNPACPSTMLIGVPRPGLCEPLARVLHSLGVRRAMVVSGEVPADAQHPARYLDELSPLGPTTIAEFYPGKTVTVSKMSPAQFPLQPATLSDLRGGDREVNASIIRQVLSGEERGPKRDAVLLNAAAALFVANKVSDLDKGWRLAAETINSGKAAKKLEELRQSAA